MRLHGREYVESMHIMHVMQSDMLIINDIHAHLSRGKETKMFSPFS